MFREDEYKVTPQDLRAWLNHLQTKATEQFIEIENARSIGSDVKASIIEITYQTTLKEISELEKTLTSMSTAAKEIKLTTKATSTATMTRALPIVTLDEQKKSTHVFSEEELKLIEMHYEKIPPHLKQLMDVVLIDKQITFDKIKSPVFIIGAGDLYDKSTADDLVGKIYPNRNRGEELVEAKNIIPCRTILDTMRLLIEIIKNNGKELDEPSLVKKSLDKSYKVRQLIAAETIEFIEENYKKIHITINPCLIFCVVTEKQGKLCKIPYYFPMVMCMIVRQLCIFLKKMVANVLQILSLFSLKMKLHPVISLLEFLKN
jgi:hypothetical protein